MSTDLNDKQEGKLEVLEKKQDITNSGLWYLCQAAGDVKDRINDKLFPVSNFPHYPFAETDPSLSEMDCFMNFWQEVEAKKIATIKYEENSLKV